MKINLTQEVRKIQKLKKRRRKKKRMKKMMRPKVEPIKRTKAEIISQVSNNYYIFYSLFVLK
jgi:hypothetical protein